MGNGRFNIYLGLGVLIAAALGGFALGKSLDPYFAQGYAQIPFWRYLTKAGHTHGMTFGLINILFGLLISHLTCSERLKRNAAVLTATSLFLPLGTCLRGLTQGAIFTVVLAVTGGFSLIGACFLLIRGLSQSEKLGL
ncbi:MAG: hypothetical protein IPP68_05435 [Elusimicrobia bacterium]|nr:hypothetical protein [Elusimicrobiota bacterium]